MRDYLMTTTFVATLARRDKTRIYEVFNTPECQGFLPARTGIGESRRFNRQQALLLMLHSDLARWGLSVPFAGKLVSRITETLNDQPDAKRLAVEFCPNGAVNFTALRGDDQPAPNPHGSPRFALTVDLANYEAAIAEAIEAEVQVIGTEDEAA